jgi:hypothetical protein
MVWVGLAYVAAIAPYLGERSKSFFHALICSVVAAWIHVDVATISAGMASWRLKCSIFVC